MKFSCTKTHLERAVTIAERFTGKNIALPVLSHILLEAEGNGLVVTATNLEHAVQFRIPAQVARLGKACLPAKIFSSLLQTISDDKVEGDGDKGNLEVRTGLRHSRVNGTNPEDFPIVPKIKGGDMFSVEGGGFSRALGRVLPAVSSSEFRPELAGVYFKIGRDSATIAATDTFRLAEHTIQLAQERTGSPLGFIVPFRAAHEINRVIEGEEGLVSVSLSENQLLIEAGAGKIVSRLIEGNFPEYQSIIPSSFATSAYIPKDDLVAGIRAASIFSSKLQEVTIRISSKQLEIASANSEVGEYRTKYPISASGREAAMSFNWRYLLDGVQAIEDEDLFWGCNQEASPAMLRNKSNTAFTYVVMPIRIA